MTEQPFLSIERFHRSIDSKYATAFDKFSGFALAPGKGQGGSEKIDFMPWT